MAMRKYLIFPKAPGLKTHHHVLMSYPRYTLGWRGLAFLQKYRLCILQPQTTKENQRRGIRRENIEAKKERKKERTENTATKRIQRKGEKR